VSLPTPIPEPTGWPDDAVYDVLIGQWSIYQRLRGHKTSTDDVLATWVAQQCMQGRAPERYLDLGCGIGSVLLMTCHTLRPGYGLGIEAQHQSAAMAQASVERLPGTENIQVWHGDFRERSQELSPRSFDLVTASPPYFPVGTGTMSSDYQRAACRFELRGGVEHYCQTAEQMLADDGQLVLVFQTEWDDRVLSAASSVGLHLNQRVDVLMREDRNQPFLTVYLFSRTPGDVKTLGFAIRDADGAITREYRSVRTELGLPTTN